MSCCPVKIDSVGTEILVRCLDCKNRPIDFTGESDQAVRLLAPSGSSKQIVATVYTDVGEGITESDGYLRFVNTSGVLDELGIWLGTPVLSISGYTGPGSEFQLEVQSSIPAP